MTIFYWYTLVIRLNSVYSNLLLLCSGIWEGKEPGAMVVGARTTISLLSMLEWTWSFV